MKPKIQRHEKIIDLVRKSGFMTIDDLANELDVTPQTMRRDIALLSDEKLLRRYHGGATLGKALENDSPQSQREHHRAEKERIASLIAQHIPDNASLFISIGSTMEAVAAALVKERKNLYIITNNIHVASIASARPDYNVIITSGVVRPIDGGITGVATVDFINQFKVDYAILSTHGVESDGSLLDYDYKEVSVMQAMIANARFKFLGVDFSKFRSHALVRLGDITDFDKVFTDTMPSEEICKILEAAGGEWLIPESENKEK